MKIFDFKSPNFGKLSNFGFSKDGKNYILTTKILDGQFEMLVEISEVGEVATKLTDLGSGELYTLHLVEGAEGSFVGAVRAEYERVLTEISEKCFEKDVFKGDCAHEVVEYVRRKYGDEPEYLWRTFPSNAVWRRKDNKKWYGVLLVLSKRKLGLLSDEVVTVIDLRIDPQIIARVVDGKRYFAGYHMNKKNWFTMCLDGSVPVEEICEWIDKSYKIAELH